MNAPSGASSVSDGGERGDAAYRAARAVPGEGAALAPVAAGVHQPPATSGRPPDPPPARGRQLPPLAGHELEEESAPRRFVVRERGRIYFVDLDEIQAIEAHGNYLHLVAADAVHRVRDTLEGVEQRLDARFVRIHRSHIVRFDHVREIQFLKHGDCMLQLTNNRRFRVGRRYRARLRAIVQASLA